MRVSCTARLWKVILTATILCVLISGCSKKYERTEMIEGTFYPKIEVRQNISMHGFWNESGAWESFHGVDNSNNFTFPESIHFSELGIYHAVFVSSLDPITFIKKDCTVVKADNLNPYGVYYVPLDELYANGKFEYHVRSRTLDEWIGFHPFWSIFIVVFSLYLSKIQNAILKKKQKIEDEKRLQKIREEQIKKEKEIERRNAIVFDIINIQYKETEREVNKTLIPTLINEIYDIYIGLHSENLNELILNGSTSDFNNIINSVKSELNRLKKLAFNAQTKGYTDEEKENNYSENGNGAMTKEKAFEIFEIKMTATNEEIKKAYRSLVMKYNTDQRANYEDHIKQMLDNKMKEINSAKDYLSKLGIL